MKKLHEANARSEADIIKLLIDQGENLEERNEKNWTVLMAAIEKGDLEIVKALIKCGADLEAKDNYRMTPLMIAVSRGHAEIVDFLINAGAKINVKDEDGETAMIFAARDVKAESIKLLAKAGGNPNDRDSLGNTALMLAVTNSNNFPTRPEAVEALIAAGADKKLGCSFERGTVFETPLSIARKKNLLDVLPLLESGKWKFRSWLVRLPSTFKKTSDVQGGSAVSDKDGNIYHTVTIGNQIWMVENLKVTRYRNGDPIPNVVGDEWYELETGAFCDYDNRSAYADDYGHMYNWYAIKDPRGICPKGWHVPNDDDWDILRKYLGGNEEAGGRMKEEGTEKWRAPNAGANNESGFKGLPGGKRKLWSREFLEIGDVGYWWSSVNDSETGYATCLYLSNDDTKAGHSTMVRKMDGLSVRCVKNRSIN